MSNATTKDPVAAKRDAFYAMLGVRTGPLTEQQGARLDKLLKQTARKAAAARKKLEEEAHKKDIAAVKPRAEYEDRRRRCDAMLAELRAYSPAADGLINDFMTAHAAADQKIDDGGRMPPIDWAAALKCLHAVHIRTALEQAQAAWARTEESGRKAAPNAFEIWDSIRRDYNNPGLPLTRDQKDRHYANARTAMKMLLVPRPEAKTVEVATEALTDLRGRLDEAIDKARTLARELQTARGDALLLLDIVTGEPPLATDREAAMLNRLKMSAAASTAEYDYQAATQVYGAMADEARSIRERAAMRRERAAKEREEDERNREEWQRWAGEVEPLQAQAAALVADATDRSVKAEAQELARQLDEIKRLVPGSGMTSADALSVVKGARDNIDALREREAAFQAFAVGDDTRPSPRAKADQRVAEHVKRVELSFGTLQSAVRVDFPGELPDIADREFRTRLAALREAWSSRIATAGSAKDFHEDDMHRSLDKLEADIADALRDTDKLGKVIGIAQMQHAHDLYSAVREATVAAAERLVALDAFASADLLAEIGEQDEIAGAAETPGGLEAPKAELKRLQKKAADRAVTCEDMLLGLQQRLEQILDPVPRQLEALRSAADKESSAARQAPRVALHATLQTEYDSQRAFLTSRQTPLLETAIDEALQLVADIADALRAIRGEKRDDGTTPPSFDTIKRKLADYLDTLNDSDVQTYATVSAFDLIEKIKNSENELGSKTISAAEKAVEVLGGQVDQVVRRAEEAKQRFEAFDEGMKLIEEKLNAPAFKDAPTYVEAVKARLKSVRSNGRFEGGLIEARNEAARIARDLDAAVQPPLDERGVPVALAENESGAIEARRRRELDRTKWDRDFAALDKRLGAMKGVDPGELNGLKSTLKEIGTNTIKSGDFETGRDQLSAIRRRLDLLQANPFGLRITARKRLPQVLIRVRWAFNAFGKALDELGQAVATTDLDDDGKKAVGRQIAAVRALFNPTAFDKSVPRVADERAGTTERAAAREKSLREIRRISAYLATDFRLQELSATPPTLRPGMAGVISELSLALLDLENNLLVSN